MPHARHPADAMSPAAEPPARDDDVVALGRVVAGVPTFISLLAIGWVVVAIVSGLTALAVSALLAVLPLPFDPPWNWFPDRAWRWGVGWVALGGLSVAAGTFAA